MGRRIPPDRPDGHPVLNLAALLAIALTTLVVTAVVTGLAMLVLRTVPQSIARGARW